eukprot:1428966-Pleurochrysis_carterae.AAC.2
MDRRRAEGHGAMQRSEGARVARTRVDPRSRRRKEESLAAARAAASRAVWEHARRAVGRAALRADATGSVTRQNTRQRSWRRVGRWALRCDTPLD